MASKILPDARMRGEREEIGNEEICIIVGVGVGVGGDSVVARRSLPSSSSSFRFRETRCWRLRWIDLHRRFFRHPGRRMQPRLLRSFDNKVRKAG
jgi:CRP-like cAMP-binding protein